MISKKIKFLLVLLMAVLGMVACSSSKPESCTLESEGLKVCTEFTASNPAAEVALEAQLTACTVAEGTKGEGCPDEGKKFSCETELAGLTTTAFAYGGEEESLRDTCAGTFKKL